MVATGPFVRTDDSCHVVHAELPDELTSEDALARAVSIGVGEPRTCAENWEMTLWYDEQARLAAVGLILGSPDVTG